MSRVERTENPTERRGNEHLRQAQRGRNEGSTRPSDAYTSRNPSKAEGDVGDVEEALKHQNE
ncbi:MAG: hypothetical protein M3Q69_01275 [Acidobacteriota bacterium]|nr:hypothetical protein [Acidobacteriota bacterium]